MVCCIGTLNDEWDTDFDTWQEVFADVEEEAAEVAAEEAAWKSGKATQAVRPPTKKLCVSTAFAFGRDGAGADGVHADLSAGGTDHAIVQPRVRRMAAEAACKSAEWRAAAAAAKSPLNRERAADSYAVTGGRAAVASSARPGSPRPRIRTTGLTISKHGLLIESPLGKHSVAAAVHLDAEQPLTFAEALLPDSDDDDEFSVSGAASDSDDYESDDGGDGVDDDNELTDGEGSAPAAASGRGGGASGADVGRHSRGSPAHDLRRRAHVDYVALAREMFGTDRLDDDEEASASGNADADWKETSESSGTDEDSDASSNDGDATAKSKPQSSRSQTAKRKLEKTPQSMRSVPAKRATTGTGRRGGVDARGSKPSSAVSESVRSKARSPLTRRDGAAGRSGRH